MVTVEHVRQAFKKIERDKMAEVVRTLSTMGIFNEVVKQEFE